ncbi:MAG: TraC family protein, partial [Pacificimonas sp.]
MSFSAKTFGARLSGALFGDGDDGDAARPALALDMLSDYLPYRYFDAERELFLNAASSGFVLAAAPLVGADERTGEILGQFFSEGMPSGACLQIVNLQSPRIGRLLAPWFQPRFLKGGVYERMAAARV